MGSRHCGFDTGSLDGLQQLLLGSLGVDVGDGQCPNLGVHVGIVHAVESHHFLDGGLCSCFLGNVEVGEADVLAGIVVHRGETQFVEGLAYLGLAGLVGIIAHEDVMLIQMRGQAVDTVDSGKPADNAVGTFLTVHVAHLQPHSSVDDVGRAVGT